MFSIRPIVVGHGSRSLCAICAIARWIPWYVPQRQTFPLRPWRISSGPACGFLSSTALKARTNPGVQKPHCEASLSTNACWMGLRVSPCNSDSIVVMDFPCASIARTEHAYTGLLSISTVQAPHSARSHTRLAPVMSELIAKGVEQGGTGFKLEGVFLAVYGELDRRLTRTINLDRLTRCLHDFGSKNRHGRSGNGGNLQEVAAGNPGIVVNFCFRLVFQWIWSCIRNLRAVRVVRKMN